MRRRSLRRRMIFSVLLVELACVVSFVLLAAVHERHTRLQAFDRTLLSNAAALFGAVVDADDAADSVMLDWRSVRVPTQDIFAVTDEQGRVLGQSSNGSIGRSTQGRVDLLKKQITTSAADRIYPIHLGRQPFHVAVLHAVREVDPGEPGGGKARAVVIRYGSPEQPVLHEIYEAILFYALEALAILGSSAFGLALLLRRGFAPLRALTEQAARVTSRQWNFDPPASARDIAELAPLTEALTLSLGNLKRSFEAQRRLTSDAAHELKTSIAIAKSTLQLLNMRRRTPEEYRGGVEAAIDDILRLEEITAKMLLVARIEHNALRVSERSAGECDAAAVLRQCAAQLQSIAAIRSVRVSVRAPETLLLRMDADDFSIVCTNLLLNALQHSRRGGFVVADMVPEATRMRLTISDDGEGIPAQTLPHIFKPFYRVDASRDRKTGGTGLGLAITRGLVESSNGSIDIRSREGEGTSVIVRCERTPQDAPAPSASLKQSV